MNLNKWLCKHFDEDDKGEVTVEDVLEELFWMVAPVILVAMYIHGAISMYNLIYVWTPYMPPIAYLAVPGIATFLLVSGIVMFEGLRYAIPRILGARIAKCERMDGDE